MKMNINLLLSLFLVAGVVASPVYAKNDKSKDLPPGLQKKMMKGESLPPGWQKKMRKGGILDVDMVKRGDIVVPLDKKGLLTIRLEGKLVRLVKATREVVEVLD